MGYIILPSILSNNNINNFMEVVNSHIYTNYAKVKFDFNRVSFFSAYALTLFILMCYQLKNDFNINIHVKLSDSFRMKNCIHILARLGLFEAMPPSTSFYPYKPKQQFRGNNPAILEITRVDQESSLVDLINLSRAAITKNTNYEGTQILDICKMMSELIQNILDHSAITYPGIILIQNYPNRNYTQLVIADSGVGIPNTIKSNSEYKKMNDAECIEKSLQYGITRYDKSEERGEGLPECAQLANKYNAKLFIRSNTGSIHYNKNRNICLTNDLCELNGTQISIKFPSI